MSIKDELKISLINNLIKLSVFVIIIYTMLFFLISYIFKYNLYMIYILNVLTIIIINLFIINKFKYFNKIANALDEFVDKREESYIQINGNGSFSKLGENINTVIKDYNNIKKDIVIDKCSKILLCYYLNDAYDIDRNEANAMITGINDKLKVNLTQSNIKLLILDTINETKEEFIQKNIIIVDNSYDLNIMMNEELLRLILEELFDNVCKYACNNTRFYIDINEFDGNMYIAFKNVSKEQVNFDNIKIDNNMGIKLCEYLSKVQNMDMNIKIDADLFITTIKITPV